MSDNRLPVAEAIRRAEEGVEVEQRKLEAELRRLREVERSNADQNAMRDAIVNAYTETMAFMRVIEREISIDELEGHSANNRWLQFRTDTAFSALDELTKIIPSLRERIATQGGDPESLTPSAGALTQMQRLVAEAYPERAADLRAKYVALGFPVLGFDEAVNAPRSHRATSSFRVSAEGVEMTGNSHDVRAYAEGSLVHAAGVTSAPAIKSASSELLARIPPPNAKPTFASRIGSWLSDVSNKIIAGLAVAMLVSVLGLKSCRHNDDTPSTSGPATGSAAPPTSPPASQSSSPSTPVP